MIKGWYTKHEDKWHQIEDVKDTGIPAHKEGGGNVVKLKGKDDWVHASKLKGMEPKPPMEKSDKIPGGLADKKKPSDFDPKLLAAGIKVELEHTDDKKIAQEIAMDHLTEDLQYYEKLKDVEKYDRVDEEADGKKELDYGFEELDKIKGRWKKLKKAVLDSSTAIMPIEEQEYQDEGSDEAGQDVAGGEDDQPIAAEDGAEDQQAPEDEAPEEEQQGESNEEPSDEELEQMLRDEGYSDSEVAHIMHGHIQPESTVDDIKVNAEDAMSEQKLDHQKRMDDLAHQQANAEGEINEMDKDHKQRMLDLEYAQDQKMKQMELKFKEEEYKLKLQSMKDKNDKVKVRDSSKSRSQDASKTSNKEKAGK